jgi:hypothetical protein
MVDPRTVVSPEPQARSFRSLVLRLWNSTVVWSWAFNGLRLGSGVLVLPILLLSLSKPDLGFYWLLLKLTAISSLLDLGLSLSIGRSVNYAMGGAKELRAFGLQAEDLGDGKPNYSLIWKLLHTTRAFYRVLALFILVVMGAIGTYIVSQQVQETSHPVITWLSWGIAILSAAFELYFGWWSTFLSNMNQVLVCGRILFLGHTIKLILTCGFLLLGWGLLSVPTAGFITSFLTRYLARRAALKLLPAHDSTTTSRAEILALLRILWPNSWRTGLQIGSGYLLSLVSVVLCSTVFGLVATGAYGLSLQIVGLIQGMAMVWTGVKWPLVGQFRARHNHLALRRLLWPRVWLQSVTFIILAVLAYQLGPALLQWLGSGKQMLPGEWFLLLLFTGFLETQFAFWTTLLAMENRIPSLWPVVATNFVTLLLMLVLVNATTLGLGALVLAPLLTGSLFNYWYWAQAGAKSLQTSWLRFTFSKPG